MDKQVIEKLTHITTVQQRTLEDLKEIKSLLKEQNGRVRNNENAVARLNVIASLMITVIAGFVTWLFGFKIQENKVDIKQMIVGYIFNDEMKAKIVKELNDNVDIPFISEKTEGKILDAVYDSVEDVIKKAILK